MSNAAGVVQLNSNQEKYWIPSDGDAPHAICFSGSEAFGFGANYIDSFDEKGKRLCTYTLNSDGETYTCHLIN